MNSGFLRYDLYTEHQSRVLHLMTSIKYTVKAFCNRWFTAHSRNSYGIDSPEPSERVFRRRPRPEFRKSICHAEGPKAARRVRGPLRGLRLTYEVHQKVTSRVANEVLVSSTRRPWDANDVESFSKLLYADLEFY